MWPGVAHAFRLAFDAWTVESAIFGVWLAFTPTNQSANTEQNSNQTAPEEGKTKY